MKTLIINPVILEMCVFGPKKRFVTARRFLIIHKADE
jgi:hypothetical protein